MEFDYNIIKMENIRLEDEPISVEQDSLSPKPSNVVQQILDQRKEEIDHTRVKTRNISSSVVIIFVIYLLGIAYFHTINDQNQGKANVKPSDQLELIQNKLQIMEEKLTQKSEQLKKIIAEEDTKMQKIVKDLQDQLEVAKSRLKKDSSQSVKKDKKKPQSSDLKQIKAQLEKISDKQQQKPGRRPVTKGTVSQYVPFKKNKFDQGIEDVMYSNDNDRALRRSFFQDRIKYLKMNKKYESLKLVKYNLLADNRLDQEQARDEEQDWQEVSKKYKLQTIIEEIPMCVVIPSYNNKARFRLESNLNSVFRQNYTNYFAVIIDDASTDGSDALFRNYLHHYQISRDKYVYIHNSERKGALENIYNAAHQYCSEDSVLVIVDGDDELIGRNVLKVFNAAYQQLKAGVVYSNFYSYQQGKTVRKGSTQEYTQDEKLNAKYRQSAQRISHLSTYRTELFRQIPQSDLKDDTGYFFTTGSDIAISLPIMEMSCGRVNKVDGYHYLFNINTGLKDNQVNLREQNSVNQIVRKQRKTMACNESFNERMNNALHG